jgi:hypothetical protein
MTRLITKGGEAGGFQASAFDSVTNNSMITPGQFGEIVNSVTLEDYS